MRSRRTAGLDHRQYASPAALMPNNPSSKPIEIKISTVVAVSVILRESDPAILDTAMREMTQGVPDYFEDEFAVIDVGFLDPAVAIDWATLIELLRFYRLNPVAVRNAAPEMEAHIRAHGLSLDTMVRPYQETAVEAPVEIVAEPDPQRIAAEAPQVAFNSMIIDTPVRAGQRIYARGCDLIITAAVNNGAEVIADGSIHIYAPLRGRALAGASGNPNARIFAALMEAELVSIAGLYRTFEHGFTEEWAQQPVQICLIDDRIEVLSIHSATRS